MSGKINRLCEMEWKEHLDKFANSIKINPGSEVPAGYSDKGNQWPLNQLSRPWTQNTNDQLQPTEKPMIELLLDILFLLKVAPELLTVR